MPISTTNRKAGPYPGNGVARDFSFNFKVFNTTELRVSVTSADGLEQVLQRDVNYAVGLNPDQDADAGGVVTLNAPLQAGSRLVVLSDVPALQPIDMTNQGGFYPDTVNEGLDRVTALVQQFDEKLGRTVTVPPSYGGNNLALPEPRPGQLLAWGDQGLSNLDPSSLVSVVAYGGAVVDKFDGDGTTTMFSLSTSPGNERNMRVSVAGVVQTPGEDFFWGGGQVLGFFSPPPAGTRIVVQFQQALPEVSEPAADLRQLINWLPEEIRAKVIAGTNTENLVTYINAALSSGRTVDAGGYTYLIGSRVKLSVNSRLLGYGTFKAMPTFSDGEGGLSMLLQPASGSEVSQGIVFDGSELTTASIYGCRNIGPLSNFKLGATFKNVSFVGIGINRNLGYWANSDITITSHVENCGWSGIEVTGCTRLTLRDTKVFRAGYNAYLVGHCNDVVASGFRADKSIPPFHIYAGPGSYGGAEEGFLFGHFNVVNGRFSDFHLYDNRNAGSDGWGIGEDGSGGFDESRDLTVVNGIVDRAGLFGFDCTGRMTVRNVIIKRAARQGLMIGLDLGGTISDLDVEVSIFDSGQTDSSAGAVMFLATGPAHRTITSTVGSPVVTIIGGTGFHVVAGQKCVGPNIPAGATVVSVDGANVTLSANATASGNADVTFRGAINYRNVRVNAKVNGAPWGVVFESDENGYATYDNVEVSGDFSQNIVNSSVRVVNGVNPAGVRIAPDTRLKTYEHTITGGAFSAFGRRAVVLSGAQLDYVINGYDGQELDMYAGTDMTINFDWANAGGHGTNRLIGNGNTDLEIKAGGLLRMVYRASVGWYCNHINAS